MGIPFDNGCSCGLGAKYAPQVIRELSTYLPPYTEVGESIKGFKLHDYGDITDFVLVMELVVKALQQNKFNLAIGGDHSVSIYLQKAFYKYALDVNKTPVIIHIDAHPDICDIYDNKIDSHATTIKRAIDNGYDFDNIILIGIRGFEEQEVVYLNEHPEIKVFSSFFLNKNGFDELLNYLINKYNHDDYIVYLSYDIDALDPSFAPGTGTPEAFGLNNRALTNFILELFKSLPILAMDIVEISPPLDNNNITSWLALKTLYEVFKIIKDKRTLDETYSS